MSERPPENSDPIERLNGVLLAFLEEVEAGHSPDREILLAEFPELRDDLTTFFDVGDDLHRLSGALRLLTGNDTGSRLSEFWRHETDPGRPEGERSSHNPDVPTELRQSHSRQLGDFRILRMIGRGGMGVVYEAEQCSRERRVALKVLPCAAAIDARQLQRFRNEAAAAAHLQHPGIVPVLEVGSESGIHYFAMQFVDGLSLSSVIRLLRTLKPDQIRMNSLEGSPWEYPCEDAAAEFFSDSMLPESTPAERVLASVIHLRAAGGQAWCHWVARLGRDVALALEYAHRTGIVHRDIKPGNLLLDAEGMIWVTDFGLAQFGTDSGLTVTGEVLGTLRYSSPEQVHARRGIVDHRSDIYSLGATLYELLTLRPVLEGRDRRELLRQISDTAPLTLRAIDPSIPRDLETIILKAVSKDVRDRYATADELAADLQRFVDGQPIVARPPSLLQNIRHWAEHHQTVVAASSAVLIVSWLGFGIGMALLKAEHGRTKAAQTEAEAAYASERSRAEEAESRFLMARRSVDALIEASEEELASRPGMELVRMRLLATALQYYEEFIEERKNDPDRSELVETRLRVQRILDDLAVLRVASRLQLLNQNAVLDDLQLTQEQRLQIRDVVSEMRRQWMNSFREAALRTSEERLQLAVRQARANDTRIQTLMTPDQQARFRQIGLRWDGVAAFRDPEVADALSLNDDQCRQIRQIEETAMLSWMNRRYASSTTDGETFSRQQVGPDATELVMELMSSEQRSLWAAMIGEPVPGMSSRRTAFGRFSP